MWREKKVFLMKNSHQSILDAKKFGRTNWNCNLYLAKYFSLRIPGYKKNPAIKTKFLFKWHPSPKKVSYISIFCLHLLSKEFFVVPISLFEIGIYVLYWITVFKGKNLGFFGAISSENSLTYFFPLFSGFVLRISLSQYCKEGGTHWSHLTKRTEMYGTASPHTSTS